MRNRPNSALHTTMVENLMVRKAENGGDGVTWLGNGLFGSGNDVLLIYLHLL